MIPFWHSVQHWLHQPWPLPLATPLPPLQYQHGLSVIFQFHLLFAVQKTEIQVHCFLTGFTLAIGTAAPAPRELQMVACAPSSVTSLAKAEHSVVQSVVWQRSHLDWGRWLHDSIKLSGLKCCLLHSCHFPLPWVWWWALTSAVTRNLRLHQLWRRKVKGSYEEGSSGKQLLGLMAAVEVLMPFRGEKKW